MVIDSIMLLGGARLEEDEFELTLRQMYSEFALFDSLSLLTVVMLLSHVCDKSRLEEGLGWVASFWSDCDC